MTEQLSGHVAADMESVPGKVSEEMVDRLHGFLPRQETLRFLWDSPVRGERGRTSTSRRLFWGNKIITELTMVLVLLVFVACSGPARAALNERSPLGTMGGDGLGPEVAPSSMGWHLGEPAVRLAKAVWMYDLGKKDCQGKLILDVDNEIEYLEKMGINQIFLSVQWEDIVVDAEPNEYTRLLVDFVSKAKDRNIKVPAMTLQWSSDVETRLTNQNLQIASQSTELIIEYCKRYDDASFDGIHVDIEPHLFGDWEDGNWEKNDQIMQGVLNTYEAVRKKIDEHYSMSDDFEFSAAIGVWWNDGNLKNGDASKLSTYLDFAVPMCYDGAGGDVINIIACVLDEVLEIPTMIGIGTHALGTYENIESSIGYLASFFDLLGLSNYRGVTIFEYWGLKKRYEDARSVELGHPHILDVPYMYQDDTYWCFLNSLSMISQYYGKRVHPHEMADAWNLGHEEGTGDVFAWLLSDHLDDYVHSLGLTVDWGLEGLPLDIGTWNFEFYKEHLDRYEPVLVVGYSGLGGVGGGHAVVVVGYMVDDSGGKYLYVHDPSGTFVREWVPLSSYPYMAVEVPWDTFHGYFTNLMRIAGNLAFMYSAVIHGTPNPPQGVLFPSSNYPTSHGMENLDNSGELYLGNDLTWHQHRDRWSTNLPYDLETGSGQEILPSEGLEIRVYVANQFDAPKGYQINLEMMSAEGSRVFDASQTIDLGERSVSVVTLTVPSTILGTLPVGEYSLNLGLWNANCEKGRPYDRIGPIPVVLASEYGSNDDVLIFDDVKVLPAKGIHGVGPLWNVDLKACFRAYARLHDDGWSWSLYADTYMIQRDWAFYKDTGQSTLEFLVKAYNPEGELIYPTSDWIPTDTDGDGIYGDFSHLGGTTPSFESPKYPLDEKPRYLVIKTKWRIYDELWWPLPIWIESEEIDSVVLPLEPAPRFFITCEADQPAYHLGETSKMSVLARNVGTATGIFDLNVSYESPSGVVYDVAPMPTATLVIGESKPFTVEWTIPKDAAAGSYEIAVNAWKTDWSDRYDDNIEWVYAFEVVPSEPTDLLLSVRIISPGILVESSETTEVTFSAEVIYKQTEEVATGLAYSWTLDDRSDFSQDPSFRASLAPGFHSVSLQVVDGEERTGRGQRLFLVYDPTAVVDMSHIMVQNDATLSCSTSTIRGTVQATGSSDVEVTDSTINGQISFAGGSLSASRTHIEELQASSSQRTIQIDNNNMLRFDDAPGVPIDRHISVDWTSPPDGLPTNKDITISGMAVCGSDYVEAIYEATRGSTVVWTQTQSFDTLAKNLGTVSFSTGWNCATRKAGAGYYYPDDYYTVWIKLRDSNIVEPESYVYATSRDITLDRVPPTTTISPSSSDSWHTSSVTVSLSATDNYPHSPGSGVDKTYYRIDSGPWVKYSGSFSADEGDHRIYYYSVDRAGNTEGARSIRVKVDTTAPRVWTTTSGGMYRYRVSVNICASDYESGISYIRYRRDSGSWNTVYGSSASFSASEGWHTYYFYAVDNVRHASGTRSVGINVNTTGMSLGALVERPIQGNGNGASAIHTDAPVATLAYEHQDTALIHGFFRGLYHAFSGSFRYVFEFVMIMCVVFCGWIPSKIW